MKKVIKRLKRIIVMTGKTLGFYIQIAILLVGCQNDSKIISESVKPVNLRCELLANPVGLDIKQPQISWELNCEQRNIIQTAYQILVASSKDKLDQNSADLWDSGKKISSKSIFIRYEGKPLQNNMQYFWKVKVWSKHGESDWSETASWSTGYLYDSDWKGRWIGLDRSFPWDDESKFSRLSARYFRKEFNTGNKDIITARLHIIGLGLYELYINGKKMGNQVLAPTPTDYSKNVKYNSFDVTQYITQGNNALGVILGNGRFYTMRQDFKPYKIKTFGYPKLLLNLIVQYTDGSTSTFSTDNSWKVTANGPIRTNNEYDGEEYDARKEMPGWNTFGFDDSEWIQAQYVQEPGGEYEAQLNENMKIMQQIKPVSISSLDHNKYILDMGQNMSGWLRIKVQGKRGQKVILRYAESLKENGEIFTANLRDAKVTDTYTLKGTGQEIWEPAFVYHGFRFVEITDYPDIPTIEDFEGCVVYDEIQTTGYFETSDPLINQIYKNAFWSIISTYKGMPIDCPQRNERMPWLGDRAIGCYGESFVTDNSRLYVKWLDDIMYSQKADGSISDVAPPYFRYYSDNMTWPGTCIFVAEMLYYQFALEDPVIKHYPHMKKWLQYMQDRYMKNYIIIKDSYGDWCAPPKTIEEGRGKNADVKKTNQLISTAYFYRCLLSLQKFAAISGNHNDIDNFKSLADSVKEAFNNTFFHSDSAFYGTNTLTDNLLPLSFEMVPENRKDEVIKTVRNIIMNEHNGHLSSGLVGVQWLMRNLTQNGMEEIAYLLVTNTTYPSWGYMIENGATTIWELWNANTAAPNMNSQNHVMLLGDLVIWFYENLAGIKSDPGHPGFKKIIMAPSFIKGLNFVKASYHSVHGLIKSNWKKENNMISWHVVIPANTSAIIYFPVHNKKYIRENGQAITIIDDIEFLDYENEKAIFSVPSGEYNFEFLKD